MIDRFIRYTSALFFLSLFTQVGKHFWPDWARISGIRVDYLSPTLYLSDILVLVLLCLVVFQSIRKRSLSISYLLVPFLLLFLTQLFVVSSIPAQLFFALKFFEFVFVGCVVKDFISRSHVQNMLYVLVLGSAASSLLALAQFFHQSSFQGPLYFLGERVFSPSSIGIALMHVRGLLLVRPYALFPHPNVLAFGLIISSIYILYLFQFLKYKWFVGIACVIMQLGILVTFSRVLIVLYFLAILGFVLKRFQRRIRSVVVGILAIAGGAFLVIARERFFDSFVFTRDFGLRIDSITVGLTIFQTHPWIGVGLQAYFSSESILQKSLSPIYLQPPHNIFIVTLLQTGILGTILVGTFLISTFERLYKLRSLPDEFSRNFYKATMVILLITLLVGLTDHFPLTLQQGQLFLAVLLGYAWSNLKA